MGAEIPKQFLPLDGRPILMRCVETFARAMKDSGDLAMSRKYEDPQIVIVLPESEIQRWFTLCERYKCVVSHTVCVGGKSRFESVRSGLRQIKDADLVAVHDGVRALLSVTMIRRVIDVAAQYGTAIPVIDLVDSLRMVRDVDGGDERGSRSVNRSLYKVVQTPQIFSFEILKRAYEQDYNPSFTDDASVVESIGVDVTLCEGEPRNIKITTPLDITIAQQILNLGKQHK